MSTNEKRAREIWEELKVTREKCGDRECVDVIVKALSTHTPATVASDFPEKSKWDAPDQFSPDDQSRAWAAGWNGARKHAMSIISTSTPAPVAGDEDVAKRCIRNAGIHAGVCGSKDEENLVAEIVVAISAARADEFKLGENHALQEVAKWVGAEEMATCSNIKKRIEAALAAKGGGK